ncbi:4a-hydroxytetrahydrobiopterin dehydratase [Leptolyngbya sp. 7M]|uniref:4a-hydroxytetrahydrobiopterin dehydratase n=1 Tax=Leptolyngbya sp. 7M TaxID=2812896 RepID=UPI001B8D22F0|nr:4a-hydroxytetrahydrobiopterin dehydratase [Leptolyngbya sp. 7M]QYO67128.1 4a-hydroxytetrahydrobiopterin dehydratase [Leptolyngbya sp. 7M]
MERRKLSREEINDRLADIAGWTFEDEKLVKRFEFPDFAASLAFVNKIGEIAEAADHHPDIKFGWGYANVETTTHDRGGVTDHDLDLARRINQIGVESD